MRRLLGPLSLVLTFATSAGAQVFQLQGGGSSLMDGYGGMLNVWGNGYEGNVGIGYLGGWRLTASARRLLGRDTLRLGHDILALQLPTDVLGGSNGMLVQGVGLQRRRGRTRLNAFAGLNASSLPAPFFVASRGEHPMAVAHAEWDANRTLRFFGDAILTTRQSLFAGARWQLRDGLSTSGTAGFGNNAPYAALSADLHSSRVDAKAVATTVADRFRRSASPLPFQSELEGLNALATWRATPHLSFTGGQQHFRQDSVLPGTDRRALLNQLSATYSSAAITAGAGVFESRSISARSRSAYVTARRDVTTWLQADLYMLHASSPLTPTTTTPVLYLRERVHPQLSLLQVLTRDRDRTSVAIGGALASGLNAVSVDYQVVHAPYRTANPLVQSIALNARLHLLGYTLSVGSYVTPDGKVNYSASGSTFFYRGVGNGAPAVASSATGRIDRYLVSGVVQDESGAPVEGAAVALGSDVVYTDSRGRFFLRRPTGARLALRVVVEEFLADGTYEVVSAPSDATPQPEARDAALVIVVRRARPR